MGLLRGTRFYHFWGQDRGGFSVMVDLEFLEAIIKKYRGICRHQSACAKCLWCLCVILWSIWHSIFKLGVFLRVAHLRLFWYTYLAQQRDAGICLYSAAGRAVKSFCPLQGANATVFLLAFKVLPAVCVQLNLCSILNFHVYEYTLAAFFLMGTNCLILHTLSGTEEMGLALVDLLKFCYLSGHVSTC